MIFDSDSDQKILNPPFNDKYLKSISGVVTFGAGSIKEVNPQWWYSSGDYSFKPVYQFQCMRCFIVSGYMSRNPNDTPICCGGEPMVAIKIERR